ncbi:MAG: hypothetical protein NUW01_08920 [Gemmatimonadaceae bacterium]|nr:hypothetical protein [Gemmatimonadaceae bacterium]
MNLIGAAGTLKSVGGAGKALAPKAAEVAPDVIQKLTGLIKGAKPLQARNKELLSQFRSRQAGAFSGALGEGEAGFRSGLGAMRGAAERVGFPPLRDALEVGDVDSLFSRLGQAGLRQFEHANAGSALTNILDGVVPTTSELEQLERAFPGVTKSLRDAKIVSGPAFSDYMRDALSLPRSLRSSFDLSGLRQSATAAYAHPVMFARNFKRSLSALGRESNFEAFMSDLDNRWYAPLRKDAGVAINSGELSLNKGEGTIISTLVNKIPGYRASQRAYTALLNGMRDALFASMLEGYGVDPSVVRDLSSRGAKNTLTNAIGGDELQRWGRLINVSTGRGDLPAFISQTKIGGSSFMWAPRLIAARVQLPFELFSSSAQVRKEAARQIVAFVGVNSTVLGLGAKAGVWEVETNPRSADFGQIRIGNQRIDPWAGFRPLANLVTRMATGERKSTVTGDVSEVDRKEIVQDFLRSKLEPLTSTGVNIWTGYDQIGNPYGVKDAPGDLLVSLFLTDLAEAVKTGDAGTIARAGLAGVGLGVNTYAETPYDEAAKAAGYDQPYSALMPAQKQRIDDAHPELEGQRSREIIARGGSRADYEVFKNDVRDQQQASDLKFSSGELPSDQWRDDYHDRQQQLVGARKVAFANLKGKERTAVDRYYQAVDGAKGADGQIDWDKVDVWVSSQPESDQNLIDENTGLGGTPTVRKFRQLTADLNKAGLFDLHDESWNTVKARLQKNGKGVSATFEEYRAEWIAGRVKKLAPKLGGTAQARAEQEFEADPVAQAVSEIQTVLRQKWIRENSKLAQAAIEMGYLSAGVANIGAATGVGVGSQQRRSAGGGGGFSFGGGGGGFDFGGGAGGFDFGGSTAFGR